MRFLFLSHKFLWWTLIFSGFQILKNCCPLTVVCWHSNQLSIFHFQFSIPICMFPSSILKRLLRLHLPLSPVSFWYGSHTLTCHSRVVVWKFAALAHIKVICSEIWIRLWCRTPVISVFSHLSMWRVFLISSRRKEDAVAIASGDKITVHAILWCPFPGAVIQELFLFFSCRQSPRLAPQRPCHIILRIAGDVFHRHSVCDAVLLCVWILCLYLAPSVIGRSLRR